MSPREAALRRANSALERVPDPPAVLPRPQRPLLFIVGAPRSGTTLLHQLLAASGACGYVSNLIARFFGNPRVGAELQRRLAPALPARSVSFESRAGNTAGWNGPHEFSWFWRRHLPLSEHDEPDAVALAGVDAPLLCRRLAGLEHALGRSVALKNPILDFVVPYLAEMLPTSRFVWVTRDEGAVARSILDLRRLAHGSERAWWSVRPADFARSADLSPAEQVAHQLSSIAAALERARAGLAPDRWRTIAYADLCARPRALVQAILTDLDLAPPADLAQRIPEAFDPRARGESERSA